MTADTLVVVQKQVLLALADQPGYRLSGAELITWLAFPDAVVVTAVQGLVESGLVVSVAGSPASGRWRNRDFLLSGRGHHVVAELAR